MPGVVRILTHKDVPKNVYTILCLIQVEPDDEPCLAVDKVRYKGEQIVAILAETRGGRARSGGQSEGRIRGAAGGLRRRGGAEAGRAAGQRVPRPELLQLRGPSLPARPPWRRREGLRRRPTTSSRSATSPRRSSMRRPRRRAASSCPTQNGRYTCYSNTQALFFTLDNTGADPQRAVPEAPPDRRHGRRRLRRQGRRDRRADRVPRRDADQPAGQIRLSAARRRCRFPRRARPSASTSRTA